MKLLVLSDSHGNYPLILRAIEQAGQVDAIIHLGDGLEDAKLVEEILDRPLLKIAGNCDRNATAPHVRTLCVINRTVLLTHGDKYGVKIGLKHLRQKAVDNNADVVLYGHTHCAAIEAIDNILFINPGCLAKNYNPNTYAILTISVDDVVAEIANISSTNIF